MTRQYRTPAQRSAEIEPRGGFSALRRQCLAEVVRWRAYVGGSYLHRPEPLLGEIHGQWAARWLEDVDASSDDGLWDDVVRVGFDARGRPVIARAIGIFPGQGKHQLLRYRDGYEEVVNTIWNDDARREVVVVHLWRDEAGRVTETRDHRDMTWRYRYDDAGRLTLAQYGSGKGVARDYRCEYDATGARTRIVSTAEGWEPYVPWDARLHAHEPDLPPAAELLEALGAELARALAAGIEAVAATMPAPRCAVLLPGVDHVPPVCLVLDAAYLASMRRHDPHPDAAFEHVGGQKASRGVREVDLVDHASTELQRMLRQYGQRRQLDLADPAAPHHHDARDALTVELAHRLNADTDAPARPVVVWKDRAHLAELASSVPAWAEEISVARRAMRRAEQRGEAGAVHNQYLWVPTIATAGRAAVETLWSDLASGAVPPQRLPEQPPADRAQLLRLLPAAGLERVADAIAADVRDAIVLVPGAGGRSLLGGVPDLPVGIAWPHRTADRPLTPLAAIDCAELPDAAQRRELLPADGTLLLFADLWFSVDGDGEELGWGTRTPADGWIAVLHVPVGAATEALEPPRELRERPSANGPGLLDALAVTPQIVPTLREPWSAPGLLGLDAGEQVSYGRLLDLVWEQQHGKPQLLGHPLPVQGDPRAAGQELLFCLPPVRGFGFETPGTGTLTFVAAAEDLRAGRWDRVQAGVETD